MERNCEDRKEAPREKCCDDRREERMEQCCEDRRDRRSEQCFDTRRETRPEPCREIRREERREKSCDSRPEQHTAVSDLIPTGSREELLCFIDKISFVVYEMLLYLDTHPDEQEALQYFHENNRLREKALHIYSEAYGPLTIATADESCSMSWEWMQQPWPWEMEGGAC